MVGPTPLRRVDLTPGDRSAHPVHLDWGPMGLRTLAPGADVVVIVDVLSFTTCVDVALGRGAAVYPYPRHDGGEAEFAADRDAVVAHRPGSGAGTDDVPSWWLSPASLADIPAGTRLVLPSPNGSALAFGAAEAGASTVVAACLRNGAAVGSAYADRGLTVAVVAAGERWRGATGPMRVALEDLLGAGSVLSMFDRDELSPEALVAVAAWHDAEAELRERLRACVSGRELIAADRGGDVDLAAQAHVSDLVPVLADGRFVDASSTP